MNTGSREFNIKFDRYLDNISNNETPFIYFSGHGVEHDNEKYLLLEMSIEESGFCEEKLKLPNMKQSDIEKCLNNAVKLSFLVKELAEKRVSPDVQPIIFMLDTGFSPLVKDQEVSSTIKKTGYDTPTKYVDIFWSATK